MQFNERETTRLEGLEAQYHDSVDRVAQWENQIKEFLAVYEPTIRQKLDLLDQIPLERLYRRITEKVALETDYFVPMEEEGLFPSLLYWNSQYRQKIDGVTIFWESSDVPKGHLGVYREADKTIHMPELPPLKRQILVDLCMNHRLSTSLAAVRHERRHNMFGSSELSYDKLAINEAFAFRTDENITRTTSGFVAEMINSNYAAKILAHVIMHELTIDSLDLKTVILQISSGIEETSVDIASIVYLLDQTYNLSSNQQNHIADIIERHETSILGFREKVEAATEEIEQLEALGFSTHQIASLLRKKQYWKPTLVPQPDGRSLVEPDGGFYPIKSVILQERKRRGIDALELEVMIQLRKHELIIQSYAASLIANQEVLQS